METRYGFGPNLVSNTKKTIDYDTIQLAIEKDKDNKTNEKVHDNSTPPEIIDEIANFVESRCE